MAEFDTVKYHIKSEVNNVRDIYDEFTDVILIIFGSAGQTAPLTLKLNKDKKIEEFDFDALDVGTLTKINLSHTITLGGVYIETITVTKNDKPSSINVNKWLEDNGEKSFDFSQISPALNTRNNSSRAASRQKSSSSKKQSASTSKINNSDKDSKTDVSKKSAVVPIQTEKSVQPAESKPVDKKEPVPVKLGNENILAARKAPKQASNLESGQGKLKPENKPINGGDFELATHLELKRVKARLYKEVAKIRYPKRREHHPFVFNDLSPYTDTREAERIVSASVFNQPIGYCNRFTAMGIVEPWVAHRMENSISSYITRSLSHSVQQNKVISKSKLYRPHEPFEGSTLAPSFPKVLIKKPKGMNGPFYYDDVEIIRNELQKNLKNKNRFQEDRNKTINDYYRMNLDQTSELTGAYHAYLENTPGSKAALEELLKETPSS